MSSFANPAKTGQKITLGVLVTLGLLALAGCVETMPKLPVAIPNLTANEADLEGTWTGTQLCGQIESAVRLQMVRNGANGVSAKYEFFNLPGQSNSEVGSFTSTGLLTLGQLTLTPSQWITKPATMSLPTVTASLFGNPERLVGQLQAQGCSRFEVNRISKTIDPVVKTTEQKKLAAPAPAPATTPITKPTVSAAAASQTTASKATNTAAPISHAEFIRRIGKQKESSLVGTSLQLHLKRGGDGGWDGFVQDPMTLTFFSCPSGSRFKGGPLVAKVAKIRSNDNGVFVQLDRCDP